MFLQGDSFISVPILAASSFCGQTNPKPQQVGEGRQTRTLRWPAEVHRGEGEGTTDSLKSAV